MKTLAEMVGERVEKSCPECGVGHRLIVRQNSHTLDYFLGCSNYPKCKYTEEIPEAWLMREQGQAAFWD